MAARSDTFTHPCDTPFSAGLRFAVEVLAWVAGPWAMAFGWKRLYWLMRGAPAK